MDLLIGHLMGDFLFQNSWMALNKTKNAYIAALHALIYTICIMVICNFAYWKLVIVFLTHLVIDHYRIAAKWRKFFSHDTELPWMILADNTMHLLILWLLSLA